jgi:hypothetical protein
MMEPLHFTIRIDLPHGMYRLHVELVYAGKDVEKFRVSGGNRSFVLQSNRPSLRAEGSCKPVEWKILELPPIPPAAVDTTTYALFKVMQEIELYLKLQQQSLLRSAATHAPELGHFPAPLPSEGQLRLF